MLIERSSKLLNLFNAWYLLNCTLIRLYTLLLESVHYFLPGLMVIFIGKAALFWKQPRFEKCNYLLPNKSISGQSGKVSIKWKFNFLNACYLFYCKRFVPENVSFLFFFWPHHAICNQKSIKQQQQQQKTWSSGEMSDLCQRISKEMPFPFPLLI